MKRLLTWLVVLVAFGGGIAAASYPLKTWLDERNAPKYLTATVSRGPIGTVVNSTGTIKPVRTVSVGAFTSGPIEKVKVDFNSEIEKIGKNKWKVRTVKKGEDPEIVEEEVEWLALIDDKLQTAALKRDEAAVANAEAELERVARLLEHAIRKEERGLALLNIKPTPVYPYISEAELDELKFGVKALDAQKKLAKASVDQAKASLQNSIDQLGYTKILPPKEIDKGIKGKVIERKVDPGQTVVGTFQTAEMFTIALEMDKHVHVYASVDEADIGMVRAGMDRGNSVKFTVDAYPGEEFAGKIREIRLNSTTTQNVVTFPVVIDAPNFNDGPSGELKLKPSTTANITFPIESKEDVLRVPVAALRYTPLKEQVRPEDRHHLEALTSSQVVTGVKKTAEEKAKTERSRSERIVWVQDGKLLHAVPVTLGLTDHQFAELLKADLADGDTVITGMEGNLLPR